MLRGFFGGLAEPPGAEGSRKGRWARRGLPGLAATAPVGHGDCVPKSLSGFGCLVGLVQGLALVVPCLRSVLGSLLPPHGLWRAARETRHVCHGERPGMESEIVPGRGRVGPGYLSPVLFPAL